MKIQLLLLIGLTAGFTACPEQVDPGFTGNTPSLSGKIENWPAGKTGSIRIRINSPSATPTLGTSVAIATDGTFSKLVYPTPSATDLTTIVGCNSSGTVTVTPSDAKSASGSSAEILNSSGVLSGSVVQTNTAPPYTNTVVGFKGAFRVYVDKDVTINGVCNNSPSFTYNNLNLKAGWNLLIQSKTGATSSEAYNGPVPNDFKFYFYNPGNSAPGTLNTRFFN